MEVLAMPPPQDFQFFGNSVPTSPRHIVDGPFDFDSHYTSAPTSPTRATAIYAHFTTIKTKTISMNSTPTTTLHIPFDWEVIPGTPKSCGSVADDDETDTEDEEEELDFSFDISNQFVHKQGIAPTISAADELFEEGKIRPLKLPPRLQYPTVDTASSLASSPRTPRSPRTRGLLSPCRRGRRGVDEGEFDPFIAAMVETTRDPNSRSRKASRSMSPFRGRSFFGRVTKKLDTNASPESVNKNRGRDDGKKWRLKDLLLFRSVSDSRVSGERSRLLSSSTSSDSTNASFGSVDSSGRALQNERRGEQRRAILEEFNKKSNLNYRRRHNLFGCIRSNR